MDNEAVIQAYEKRIAEHQKELRRLRDQIRAAENQNATTPPPLDLVGVKALLANGRDLLNQEIPAAAEAIRALTGPIKIRQEMVPGKSHGARWIATFSPDLLGFLRRLAKAQDCPESVTLEYLCSRIWITPESVEVATNDVPMYERIAGRAGELAARGTSVMTIASALEVTCQTVRHALEFDKTGSRPKPKPSSKGTQRRRSPTQYLALTDQVVQLRDRESLSFTRIAERLGTTVSVVVRAYDHGHPEHVRSAAEKGQRPRRGRYSFLKPEVFERIKTALNAGQPVQQIAAVVGCGTSTVYKVRRRLLSAEDDAGPSDRRPTPGSLPPESGPMLVRP